MKTIRFGRSTISSEGPCYVIAEIGHNHCGSLETALRMVAVAATCGVQMVKFQKRDNKSLYTRAFYDRLYDNENSYGTTYGEHREALELGWHAFVALKQQADVHGVEFAATPFDFASVAFLEDLGVTAYKVASGDITNLPFLRHIARLGKPMIMSTGASSLAEIRRAYDEVLRYHDQLVLLHCVASYPAEYEHLNLRAIEVLKRECPEAVIGFSSHDNGVLAPVVAYMLGATVVEKHFTLNRAWKGVDHKFSLEPEGLRKQVRDLRRVDLMMGDGERMLQPYESAAREKMGKGIYAARALAAGTRLGWDDIVFKSPATTLPPSLADDLIGRRLLVDVASEAALQAAMIDGELEASAQPAPAHGRA
jgi:sialic acid synthase